jgi:hypothetical protein
MSYILTANHCLQVLNALDNRNTKQWTFYWDYEHSGYSDSLTQPTLRTSNLARRRLKDWFDPNTL